MDRVCRRHSLTRTISLLPSSSLHPPYPQVVRGFDAVDLGATNPDNQARKLLRKELRVQHLRKIKAIYSQFYSVLDAKRERREAAVAMKRCVYGFSFSF